MTYNVKTTATATLIALMAAAPLAAGSIESGSPQQSVMEDPNEYVERDGEVTNGSVTKKMETGSPELAVDNDANEDVDYTTSDNAGTIADELPTNSPQVSGS